jgi:hypothetical protein
MKELYLKENGQNEPLRYIRRDDGKDPDNSRFEYSDEKGTWATHYPSHELLVENGWFKQVNDPLAQYEKYDLVNYEWYTDTVSFSIIPWTQEEIDAKELRDTNEDLLVFLEASSSLSYWKDKTDQEIKDLIAATPNTFAGFRANDEKLALAVADIVKILKLLRDTGRLF